jgi:peptidylprolyl isomerase/peptidyl-prolyl cis-trans isomerase B (cyclophilin B)
LQSSISRFFSSGYRGGSPSKSSFPWHIVLIAVVLLIVLILLYTFVFKKKPANNQPPESTQTTILLTPTSEVATSSDQEESGMPEVMELRDRMYTTPPEMQIDPTKIYLATFDTEKGEIIVELFADKAPVTVNNFVFLAREGYFDNTTFHRVIEDFMAQGGDPTGTGTGGPGYSFQDEFHPDLTHDSAGVLSMANAGPGTNGSQFFITFTPTPWLDGHHSVFGKVVKGMEALLSLSLRDPQTATEPGDTINSITIAESDVSLLPTPTPVAYVQPGEIPVPAEPKERDGLYAGRLPAMIIDPEKTYRAVIKMERGDIAIDLHADKVPNTVNNFIFLAREGYYDSTTFHRVIEDFMAQAGDPTGTGSGGPGYKFADEINLELRHDDAGILSMANAGANTNGSQFFITFDATPWLDGAHTVFGKVSDGFDILENITLRDPTSATEPGDLIETIEIIEE